jgi:hypothetical protein
MTAMRAEVDVSRTATSWPVVTGARCLTPDALPQRRAPARIHPQGPKRGLRTTITPVGDLQIRRWYWGLNSWPCTCQAGAPTS